MDEMANPYKVKFKFRERTLPSGDIGKEEITFTVNEDGTDQEIQAEDNNVFFNNLGVLERYYDLDKLLLLTGFLDQKIAVPKDINGVNLFDKYLFGIDSSTYLNTDKRAEVLLEIKYQGESNFTQEFKGKIIPETIVGDETPYISFTVAPDQNILNRTILYDLDGNPLNPFNYQVPIGGDQAFRPLREIVLKSFQVYDPALQDSNLELFSDWTFGGYYYDPISQQHSYVDDVDINEIWIDIWPLFFENSFGLYTIADLLRKLAIDFSCLAGIEKPGKVFFKKLFLTQTLIPPSHSPFSLLVTLVVARLSSPVA